MTDEERTLLNTLDWSKPKHVNTRYGEKILSKTSPTEEFWQLWRAHKSELKANGYSLSKDGDTWELLHWNDLPKEVLEEREASRKLSKATDAEVEVPSPEGLEYLPYQRAGIAFAMSKDAVLIGDEMGLGKTIQSIGTINGEEEIKRVLIICPASLRLNWRKELNAWLTRDLSVGVVDRSDYPENADIVIINYDIVKKHHKILTDTKWDLLIIDEVHYLKNQKSQRTQFIFGKSHYDRKAREWIFDIQPITATKRIYLTGTPIVNRPVELFPIINSLDPVEWPKFWPYAIRYCGATRNKYGWDVTGASNLEELQDRLRSTIMIRRLKKDVLKELPNKRRQIIEVPTTPADSKLINAEKEVWNSKEKVIANLKAAVELSKASEEPEDYKIAVNQLKEGVSAFFREMAKLRYEVAMAKVPYVLEHLNNIEEKVVVFAHHKDVVKSLKENLGSKAVVLVGDTKMEDRQKAVEQFQGNDDIKVFIGSIQAAGVGITLTAASHVVFAELDWVPGNMSQAESRCHRIGQQESVLVQHLVLEGSLDAYMAQTLIQKQEIIDKALDTEYDREVFELPVPDRTNYPTQKEVVKEAEKISAEEVQEIHAKLRLLASMDNDHATYQNGIGFNGVDTHIGHSLANALFLTPKQAVIGRQLVHKYRRQLGD